MKFVERFMGPKKVDIAPEVSSPQEAERVGLTYSELSQMHEGKTGWLNESLAMKHAAPKAEALLQNLQEVPDSTTIELSLLDDDATVVTKTTSQDSRGNMASQGGNPLRFNVGMLREALQRGATLSDKDRFNLEVKTVTGENWLLFNRLFWYQLNGKGFRIIPNLEKVIDNPMPQDPYRSVERNFKIVDGRKN